MNFRSTFFARYVLPLVGVSTLAGCCCLPTGPIGGRDRCRDSQRCPGEGGDLAMPAATSGAVMPPHSRFHPVPTQPVFSPRAADAEFAGPDTRETYREIEARKREQQRLAERGSPEGAPPQRTARAPQRSMPPMID
jgi:hypothetical protein